MILICYSIDSSASLENVREKWAIEVKHHAPGVPFVLCGLKMDLRGEGKGVSVEQGQEMCDEIGGALYMECSAKTNVGVDEVLGKCVRMALAFKVKKKAGCCVL